jgi:hypothetical protein
MNNHEISLQQAIDMTTRYRANKPANAPICETFDITAVNQLAAVTGCTYMRIYYGMKENMDIDAILVAVNESNEDILPSQTGNEVSTESGDPVILEDGYRCPPDCPPKSPLNGN